MELPKAEQVLKEYDRVDDRTVTRKGIAVQLGTFFSETINDRNNSIHKKEERESNKGTKDSLKRF